MHYMITGHKSGALVVWDMKLGKSLTIIDEVHESDVVSAKVYYFTED
jgi:hypothetical protein